MVEKGDRIELISTSDPYTNLSPGATGTVTGTDTVPAEVSPGPGPERQIWVDWDDGGSMALIYGEDSFKRVDDE